VASDRGPIGVFLVALRLGLTSFGGPVAHIGYFRREYVERRRWLDEHAFAQLVALCQSLPGPASSQLGIAVGTLRAGLAGGLAAWLGFTLPSAAVLIAFALLTNGADIATAPWAHGLKLAAVAVVAQAVWAMRRSLAPDLPRIALAVVALAIALLWPSPFAPLAVILLGAVVGLTVLAPLGAVPAAVSAPEDGSDAPELRVPIGRRGALVAVSAFAILLVGLPLLARAMDAGAAGPGTLDEVDAFYRAGALVFGGGHVVLPLLHDSIVTPGWLDEGRFLAGYGAAQAVPGPLFTFSSYLGAEISVGPGGVPGAVVALVAIFLPGMLLIWAALPFWASLRSSDRLRAALAGTGAAVVGLLGAALYDPIWTGSVGSVVDAALAAAGFVTLAAFRAPPIAVVLAIAVVAQAFGLH
jgi:chromate transporter